MDLTQMQYFVLVAENGSTAKAAAEAMVSQSTVSKSILRLERELEDGDAFLDEAVQRVTVYPEDLLVEVAELPVQFRVRAEGRGTGAEYTVAVRACLSEPRERE